MQFDAETIPTLNDTVKALRKIIPSEVSKCWVAGGAVRDLLQALPIQKDVDVFFPSQEAFETMETALIDAGAIKGRGNDQKVRYNTEDVAFDLIKSPFRSPEQLSEHADFTVATGVVSIISRRMWAHELIFSDLAAKVIRISNLPNPFKTFLRVPRYLGYGFTMDYGQAIRLAHHVRSQDLDKGAKGLLFDWDE